MSTANVKIGDVVEWSFYHKGHVEVDLDAPMGFTGLPKEWENFLLTTGIPKEEILDNPWIVRGLLRKNPMALVPNIHQECDERMNALYAMNSDNKYFLPNEDDVEVGLNRIWDDVIKKNVDLDDVYPVRRKIGEGSFGCVYVTRNKDAGNTEELIALKEMYVHQCGIKTNRNENNIADVLNEIAMMKLCQSCSQIVHFHEAFLVKKTPEEKTLWIAMEYMAGGSLENLINANEPLEESVIAYILREMILGLDYLHKRHRVHRDIKSLNVLLSLEGDIKLADFGFCAQLTEEVMIRKTACGSPYWMSPELINEVTGYTEKTDIWSLGITAMELVEGKPPYFDLPPFRAACKIASKGAPGLKHPEKYSTDLKFFIECCLFDRPFIRHSTTVLLTHPLFRNVCPKEALIPLIKKSRAWAGVHDDL